MHYELPCECPDQQSSAEGLKEKEKKNTGKSEKKRTSRAAQLNLRYVEGNVPLLVIYVVNPHSKAKPGARRRDLDAVAPVVLHAVVLPQVAGSDYSNFISVVPEQVEDLALDEEELDENSSILAAVDSDDAFQISQCSSFPFLSDPQADLCTPDFPY